MTEIQRRRFRGDGGNGTTFTRRHGGTETHGAARPTDHAPVVASAFRRKEERAECETRAARRRRPMIGHVTVVMHPGACRCRRAGGEGEIDHEPGTWSARDPISPALAPATRPPNRLGCDCWRPRPIIRPPARSADRLTAPFVSVSPCLRVRLSVSSGSPSRRSAQAETALRHQTTRLALWSS